MGHLPGVAGHLPGVAEPATETCYRNPLGTRTGQNNLLTESAAGVCYRSLLPQASAEIYYRSLLEETARVANS